MVISRNGLIHVFVALTAGMAIAGCAIASLQATPTNTPAPTDVPTSTAVPATSTVMPTRTPTAQPTETEVPAVNPIPDFPLEIGSIWVYSYTEYFDGETNTRCCITLEVTANQMVGDFFVAEIEQNQTFVPEWPPFESGAGKSHFWYALSQAGEVYYLPDLLPEGEIAEAYLAYLFPLGQSGCWYHYHEDRVADTGYNCTFSDGPQEFLTPAGSLPQCYWVVTPYNNGGEQEWLCEGVGFAGNQFDHQGTPFGYETALLEYRVELP